LPELQFDQKEFNNSKEYPTMLPAKLRKVKHKTKKVASFFVETEDLFYFHLS